MASVHDHEKAPGKHTVAIVQRLKHVDDGLLYIVAATSFALVLDNIRKIRAFGALGVVVRDRAVTGLEGSVVVVLHLVSRLLGHAAGRGDHKRAAGVHGIDLVTTGPYKLSDKT